MFLFSLAYGQGSATGRHLEMPELGRPPSVSCTVLHPYLGPCIREMGSLTVKHEQETDFPVSPKAADLALAA